MNQGSGKYILGDLQVRVSIISRQHNISLITPSLVAFDKLVLSNDAAVAKEVKTLLDFIPTG